MVEINEITAGNMAKMCEVLEHIAAIACVYDRKGM